MATPAIGTLYFILAVTAAVNFLICSLLLGLLTAIHVWLIKIVSPTTDRSSPTAILAYIATGLVSLVAAMCIWFTIIGSVILFSFGLALSLLVVYPIITPVTWLFIRLPLRSTEGESPGN